MLLMALLVAGLVLWAATQFLVSGSTRAPIVISLRGNVATTLDPANLTADAVLERRISALPGVASVLGPATLIDRQAAQINVAIRGDVAAMSPADRAAARKALATVLVHYGYVGLPSLGNQSFIGQLIFGSGTAPKRQFAAVFPDDGHARVTIELRGHMSDARAQALRTRIGRLLTETQLQGVGASL